MRLAAIAPIALGIASLAAAERPFTYLYHSATAPTGAKEIEIWTTYRRGHVDESYARQDNRLEFEIGLTDRLQTAIYYTNTQKTIDGVSETEQGFAWETKYRLTNTDIDAFGSAISGEVAFNSEEFELEVIAIIDKAIGDELFAANVKIEPEWSTAPGAWELAEIAIDITFGWSHRFSPMWSTGVELRSSSEIEHEADEGEYEFENSALFLGPNVHVSVDQFWCTLTILPQIIAFKGATGDGSRDLEGHERLEIRLIAGLHF
jgi:hypothetical protein